MSEDKAKQAHSPADLYVIPYNRRYKLAVNQQRLKMAD
jgi:hypothetical protein